MPIQIGARPDSGFDDPLGMLRDCHRRIERFLHILCTVAARASDRPLNREEADAISAALHYFQQGGLRHNADEEESLFPHLRSARPDAPLDDLAHLEDDHRRTGRLHQQVETIYREWINTGTLGSGDRQTLLSATSDLQRIYINHIKLEESTVFPYAARVLDPGVIAAIGSEFQSRRK